MRSWHNVEKVVALSTDKAVSPINLYGATKLCSDKLFIAANNIKGTSKKSFSVLRYGNVTMSRGSVIPFFLKNKNNIYDVTDPNMTRFCITLEQSVQAANWVINNSKGGEIFIPKCVSLKIVDLAKALKNNVSFKFIGLRPGEKLHEVLCPKDDSLNTIEFSKFFIIKPTINFGTKRNFKILPTKETGKNVVEGFEYNSLNNKDKIFDSKIKALLKKSNF